MDAASAVSVALYWSWLGQHGDSLGWGQLILLLILGYILIDVLFIQRWPRSEALRKAMKLKPGQRLEVEGAEDGRLWARMERR